MIDVTALLKLKVLGSASIEECYVLSSHRWESALAFLGGQPAGLSVLKTTTQTPNTFFNQFLAQGVNVTLEEIKQWVLDNKKGIIVGAVAAIVIRSIIR